VCLGAPGSAGRERFYFQLLNGGYASTERRISFARFATSQRKLSRANRMFRAIVKLLPVRDSGMNEGAFWGQSRWTYHRSVAPSQHIRPDINNAVIDHSERASRSQ
jgi:hypothetical protein